MKYVFWVILVFVCFGLGRVMYGPLAPALVGNPAAKKTGGGDAKEVRVEGPGGAMTVVVKLSEITDEDVPEKVTLKKRVQVAADGQDPIYLEAGAKVLVKRREGNNLVIGPMAGPLEGMTKIASTDLVEQVAKKRVEKMMGGPAVAQNDPPQPAPPQGGPKPPQGGPQPGPPNPPPVAQNDPPMEQPEPEPEPEPEPAEAKALSPEEIVTVMQESVKGGQIKEFKFAQVEGWKAGEDENVDGETYQTGLAAYKAETIFGVKTVQAKALINNGKVVKWVYAKTGMEIR